MSLVNSAIVGSTASVVTALVSSGRAYELTQGLLSPYGIDTAIVDEEGKLLKTTLQGRLIHAALAGLIVAGADAATSALLSECPPCDDEVSSVDAETPADPTIVILEDATAPVIAREEAAAPIDGETSALPTSTKTRRYRLR